MTHVAFQVTGERTKDFNIIEENGTIMTIFDSARIIMFVPVFEGFHEWDRRETFTIADMTLEQIEDMFGFSWSDSIMTPETNPDDRIFDVFDSDYLARNNCSIGVVEDVNADNISLENVLIGFPTPRTLEKYLAHMYEREMKNHPLALYSRS